MNKIEFFGFEEKRCSKCGKLHAVSSMYSNKREGNLWCMYCLGLEKNKREGNHRHWDKKLGHREKEDD